MRIEVRWRSGPMAEVVIAQVVTPHPIMKEWGLTEVVYGFGKGVPRIEAVGVETDTWRDWQYRFEEVLIPELMRSPRGLKVIDPVIYIDGQTIGQYLGNLQAKLAIEIFQAIGDLKSTRRDQPNRDVRAAVKKLNRALALLGIDSSNLSKGLTQTLKVLGVRISK